MRTVLASLLLATAVAFGPAAHAADPPKPTSATAAPPAAGHGAMVHPGMGHGAKGHRAMGMGMGMGMGAMHCMGLSEVRLAAVRTELNITTAQAPQWDAFADAMKSNAAAMHAGMMRGGGAGPGGQAGRGMMTPAPLPERLERQEAMMTAHLDALRKTRAAVTPLYAALTPDQKAKADRLLCGGMDHHDHGDKAGHHGGADHH